MHIHKYKNLMFFTSMLFAANLSFSTISVADSFKTNVLYPELINGTIFPLLSNYSHKLQFYTGQHDGKSVNGYFRSQHFLGWTNYSFAPLDAYDTAVKNILAVAHGPANNTIVLSNVEGVGQLLSNSTDDKHWQTIALNTASNYFDTMTNTQVYGADRVMLYGKKQQVFFTTNNSSNWFQWTMPTGCNNNADGCTFENNYLGSFVNNFIIIQSTVKTGVRINNLYYSPNLQNWYYTKLPFANDSIQKVFKSRFNIMSASVIDSNGNHKLWLTPDLENWVNFDLPKNAKLADLVVNNNNRIDLLLVYKTPVENSDTFVTTTELMFLDPESKNLTLVHKFSGEVTNMQYLDNKLYVNGNFVNDSDNSHAILASMNM